MVKNSAKIYFIFYYDPKSKELYLLSNFQILHFLNQNTDLSKDKLVDIFASKYESLLIYGLSIVAEKQIVEDSIQDLFLIFCKNESLLYNAVNQEVYIKSSLKRALIRKIEKERTVVNIDQAKLLDLSTPSYEDILIESQETLQEALFVKSLLDELTATQKTVMTLRFYKGLSYEEISEKMGSTKRTVYNQIHDAMTKMKAILKK